MLDDKYAPVTACPPDKAGFIIQMECLEEYRGYQSHFAIQDGVKGSRDPTLSTIIITVINIFIILLVFVLSLSSGTRK